MLRTDTQSPPRQILPIQYLRGIAAVFVVLFHSVGQRPDVAAILPSTFGNSGVDLFFVISGFIMVVTTRNSRMSAREFFRRRVVRVVPLYWLLTLAMVAAAVAVPALVRTLIVTPKTLLESLLFIPHFSHSFPTKVWPLLVPGWTLNFEMFFYLVFAGSLLLPLRTRLPALAATFAVLVGSGFLFGPFASAAAQVYTSPVLLEFVAGALIANWWLSGSFPASMAASVVCIGVGAVLLVLRDQYPLGSFNQMTGAALVVFGSLHPSFATWLNRPLKALGDSSYSLYLTHLFTLGVLRVVWAHIFKGPTTLPLAALFVMFCVVTASVIGYLVYRWIETPLLHRLQHVGRPRAALAPTTP